MSIHRTLAFLTILVSAAQASAGITLLSGTGTLVLNPNNMKYFPDAYNIDRVFYWTESTAHTLASDLVVSILPPPSFPTDSTNHSNDSSLTIPLGTTIDSYLLNYDPQGGATIASFQFDDPIVGLITNARDAAANDHFMLSDFLIDPLVPAPNLSSVHVDDRGIEPPSGDMVRWLSATQIEIHIGASSPGDQIRVLTSRTAPEPATLLMLGMGLMTIARFRRR